MDETIGQTQARQAEARQAIKVAERALIETIEANLPDGANARAIAIATNHIQTGAMWGVRALYNDNL